MSESEFSMNSSCVGLCGVAVGGKGTQISDMGQSESKSLLSTNRNSWSEEVKETQTSDLGKSESKSLVSINLNSWSDEGKETQKPDLGKPESKCLASTSHNSWPDEGKETQNSDIGNSSKQLKPVSGHPCSRLFRTVTQLNWRGESFNVSIDCDSSKWNLLIMVENRVAVNVEHLVWNFRGIKVFDGGSVTGPVTFEVVWNVKDWLFDEPMMGEAIFIFRKVNPNSAPLATTADFSASSDIHGYPLMVYAWKQEDQIE